MKNLSGKRVGLGGYNFFKLLVSFVCLFVCLFVVSISFRFEPHFSAIFINTYCNFYFKV